MTGDVTPLGEYMKACELPKDTARKTTRWNVLDRHSGVLGVIERRAEVMIVSHELCDDLALAADQLITAITEASVYWPNVECTKAERALSRAVLEYRRSTLDARSANGGEKP